MAREVIAIHLGLTALRVRIPCASLVVLPLFYVLKDNWIIGWSPKPCYIGSIPIGHVYSQIFTTIRTSLDGIAVA